MSNDLRELASDIVSFGCPTTYDDQYGAACFYCGRPVPPGKPMTHADTCPWPPFEAEVES